MAKLGASSAGSTANAAANSSAGSATPQPNAWVSFLTDEPRAQGRDDRLDAHQYVQALLDIIQRSRPPLTIGLFGSWGIGKSTILGRLHDRLSHEAPQHPYNGQPILSVFFDIWKYEDDALRRQLLLAIEAAANKRLADAAKGVGLSERLYQRTTIVRELPPQLRRRAFVALAVVAVVSVASGLVTAAATANAFAGAVVFAAILVTVQQLINKLIEIPGLLAASSTIETRGANIEYPEEFERAFRDLAEKCGTLVLLLDNLDRCEPHTVIELLRTVKTFLEPGGLPVFIVIACDDVSLAEYLDAAHARASGESNLQRVGEDPVFAESYGHEFLRKFFAVGVRVAPPPGAGVVTYAQELLAESAVRDWAEDTRHYAAQKIAIVVRSNPRHVLQFVNRLSAKRVLVDQRVARKALPLMLVDPAALLFACAIEEHAPDFGVAIVQQPAVLADLRARVDGSRGLGVSGTDEFFKRNGIVRLVRTFVDVPAENVVPLLAMRPDDEDQLVSGAAQVREALTAGNWEAIAPRLSESGATLDRLITFVVLCVGEYYKANLTAFSANANEVAGRLAGQLLQLNRAKDATDLAREVLAEPLRHDVHRERVLALSVPALTGLLRAAPPNTLDTALQYLVPFVRAPETVSLEPLASRLKDVSHRRALALAIAGLPTLPAPLHVAVSEMIAAIGREDPSEIDRLIETPATHALITSELVALRLQGLGTTPVTAGTEPDALGFRLLRFAKQQSGLRAAVTTALVQVIAKTPQLGEGAPVVWRGVRSLALDDSVLEAAPIGDAIAAAVEILEEPSRSLAGAELLALVARQTTPTPPWLERLRLWLGDAAPTAMREALTARFGSDPTKIPQGMLVANAIAPRASSLTDADFLFVLRLTAAHDPMRLPGLVRAVGQRPGLGLSPAELRKMLIGDQELTSASSDALVTLLGVVPTDAQDYQSTLATAIKRAESSPDAALAGRVLESLIASLPGLGLAGLGFAAPVLADVLTAATPRLRDAFVDFVATVASDDPRRAAVDEFVNLVALSGDELDRGIEPLVAGLSDAAKATASVTALERVWKGLSPDQRTRIGRRAVGAASGPASDMVLRLARRAISEREAIDAAKDAWRRAYDLATRNATASEFLAGLAEAAERCVEYQALYYKPLLINPKEMSRIQQFISDRLESGTLRDGALLSLRAITGDQPATLAAERANETPVPEPR